MGSFWNSSQSCSLLSAAVSPHSFWVGLCVKDPQFSSTSLYHWNGILWKKWKCGSVTERLPSRLQALVSIFSVTKKNKVEGFGAAVTRIRSLACPFEFQFVPVLPYFASLFPSQLPSLMTSDLLPAINSCTKTASQASQIVWGEISVINSLFCIIACDFASLIEYNIFFKCSNLLVSSECLPDANHCGRHWRKQDK